MKFYLFNVLYTKDFYLKFYYTKRFQQDTLRHYNVRLL